MKAMIPIALAAIATAIAATTGNIGAALLFGIVIGATSWGAFVWKPQSRQDNQPAPEPAQPPSMPTQLPQPAMQRSADDLPTPVQVGHILALSVAEAMKHGMNQAESDFIRTSQVSVDAYRQEAYFLTSASALAAAESLIDSKAIADDVVHGFLAHWDQVTRNVLGVSISDVELKRRFTAYKEAATTDSMQSNPLQLRLSAMGQRLAEFVAASAGHTEMTPSEAVLAMSPLARNKWEGMHIGASSLFKRAGLQLTRGRA